MLVFKHVGVREQFLQFKKESEVGDSSLTSRQKKCFKTDSKERCWMHCPDKLLKTMCMTLQLQRTLLYRLKIVRVLAFKHLSSVHKIQRQETNYQPRYDVSG